MTIFIGTAGWNIPKIYQDRFPEAGTQANTHLERYAQRFRAVEINTSFYRPHRPETYARWAESVPAGFRFAVKVPKEITHERRLVEATGRLDSFLSEAIALGEKLGPLLVQLPPSLRFDARLAGSFFAALRERFSGSVVCEPRHAGWFTPQTDRLLHDFEVARVAADPASHPLAAEPGGLPNLVYYRLHGSPQMYYSAYTPAYLEALALKLAEQVTLKAVVWCIFDNTAEEAAAGNALELVERLEQLPPD